MESSTYSDIKSFVIRLEELTNKMATIIKFENIDKEKMEFIIDEMTSDISFFRYALSQFESQTGEESQSGDYLTSPERRLMEDLWCPELVQGVTRMPELSDHSLPDGQLTSYPTSPLVKPGDFVFETPLASPTTSIRHFACFEGDDLSYVCGGIERKARDLEEVSEHMKLEAKGQCWECNVHEELMAWASE